MLSIELEANEILSLIKKSGLYVGFLKETIRNRLIGSESEPQDSEVIKWLNKKTGKSTNENDIAVMANERGLTALEFIEHLRYNLKYEKWCMATFLKGTDSLFIKHKKSLTKLAYSIIYYEEELICKEYHHQIMANEKSFNELYIHTLLSICEGSASTITPTAASDVLDEIADKLLSMSINEICEPFQVNHKWVILRLDLREDPALNEKTRQILCSIEGHHVIEQELLRHLKDN